MLARLPLPTALLALAVAATMAIPHDASAAERVYKLQPVRATTGIVAFDVPRLGKVRIRSARLRVQRRSRAVSIARVRRASHSRVLRVRLPAGFPAGWRSDGADASRRVPRARVAANRARLVVTVVRRANKLRSRSMPRNRSTSRRKSRATQTPPPTSSIPAAPTVDLAPSARVPIRGATYYVSPSGSDSNSGLTPGSAWRTIAKINRAALEPGDGVLLEGGATFSDGELTPPRSGASGAHIVFGSYGGGRAVLTKGIWLRNSSWLAFQDLGIVGAGQGVVASANGSGTSHVVLQGLHISDVGIGINAANAADADWRIESSTIDGADDSGIILLGSRHDVVSNTILHTGRDASISYGKHGIYLKASHSEVIANTITDFDDDGVSIRYRNSVVLGNSIANGAHGIAWHQYDTQAGTSHWRQNSISGTTAAGIYVSPGDVGGATRESFIIADNTIDPASGRHVDLRPTSGEYSTAGNVYR
jgi:hypothetical protein